MEKSDKYEGILQKVFGSSDAFTAAQEVMLALLFVPYCLEHGGLALALLPVAAILPVALMPLIYCALHRFDTLLFGRYHLVMPLSALLAAPFFVLAFSAKDDGAASVCKIFFGFLFFVVFSLVYRYCSFSVRARLFGEDVQKPKTATLCFAALGGLSAIGAVIGFWFYDNTTAFVNSAYVISAAGLILAAAQYLTTFYGIPKLGGKRVQSVKSVYRAFYTGIDVRSYLSSFFFASSFAVQTVLAVYLSISIFGDKELAFSVCAADTVAFAITGWIAAKLIKRRSLYLSISAGSCLVIAAALFVTSAFAPLTQLPLVALATVGAVFSGAGGAIALRQMRLRMTAVKRDLTSGIVQMLIYVTCYAAIAAGLVAAMFVWMFNSVSTAGYAFGCSAALAIVALGLGSKRVSSFAAPALSYEPITQETETSDETPEVAEQERDEQNNDRPE